MQEKTTMFAHIAKFRSAGLLAALLFWSTMAPGHAASRDGVVVAKSAYPIEETVSRLKEDIADKGIRFFLEVDQAKLAAEAGIDLSPSRLLIFGNPPLGTQFLTSNPVSGLDWPVRLLVFEDQQGAVWTAYTDFRWIAERHGIADRAAQFEMASTVIRSITSAVAAK
jgi:uncharacterized protein (DUF302 family)